jgi:dihydroxyacetone kinase-like protein
VVQFLGSSIAVTAAQQGNEAARMMKSQHGKAAVYQDQTIGKEDPGARVGVLIMEGFASALPPGERE